MYVIPTEDLKKGDIILTSEKSFVSKAVRFSTKSQYSHAMLYVGSSSFIHSDRNGVHSGNIERLLFEKPSNVCVARVNCSTEHINKTCIFARTKIGTKYSIKDAIRVKRKSNKMAHMNRQFCSRLVAQAFEYAGILLVKDSSFCTPEDLLNAPIISKIKLALRRATSEDIGFARSESPLEKQLTLTNDILSNVRKITKADIQTLNQVTDFIVKNPGFDSDIADVYSKTEYFSMWQHDVKNNNWRYDGELFISLPTQKYNLIKLAETEKNNAKERLSRYVVNFTQYNTLNNLHKLKYLKLHVELYRNLIEITIDNIVASEFVLHNTKI